MTAPMTPLPQATLQEMSSTPVNPKPVGQPIKVQFNPTTLRLSMTNNVDMKKAFGRAPVAQVDGTSSSTLTFDLVFDCTDLGTTAQPVDVRSLVQPIEKFLLPAAKETKSIPPRVQFTYGTFQLIGVMSALNSEYDLFSSNGVPLRAKLNVTIKEQLPAYEAGKVGSGANNAAQSQDPQSLVPPGGTPQQRPDQTGTALDGESAPDFAARMGLDPAAWKALDLGGLDPLSLGAGVAIDFSASVGVDLGVTAGVTVGASSDAPIFGGAVSPSPAAVTAAGGLSKALDSDARKAADTAASASRAGFAVPAVVLPAIVSPFPTMPDRRGQSFGLGVPLRPTIEPPDPYGKLRGPLESGISGDVPTTNDPTVPGWLALRALPSSATGAGSGCGCQCGGCGAGCGSTSRRTSSRQPTARAAQWVAPTPSVPFRAPRVRSAARSGCGGCKGCGG